MFRTHSPYSPFFTSGLLSEPVPRRGSLPTSRSLSDVTTLYFTLQPRDEFRSFLSLDLAESQSMRSASLKRKASSSTKSPAHSSRHPFCFPPISEAASPAPSLRMRFSRDSLRTIPSPKPAPSITLPDLPTKPLHSSTAPRLPSIPVIPALDFTLPPTVSSSPPRPPPQLKLNLAKGVSAWSDKSSKLNRNRVSVVTTSTVSTRARRNNRSDALARLEGRYRRLPAIPSPSPSKNFMSMSDDEDSEGDADEGNNDDDSDDDSEVDASDLESFDFNLLTLNPLMEPEDCVLPLPLPSPSFLEAPRSAPLPPTRPYSRTKSHTRGGLLSAGQGPSGARKQHITTTTRKASSRKPPTSAAPNSGPSTTSDWFPLKSFIDLRNERDDSTRGTKGSSAKTGSSSSSKSNGRWSTWRSFIEVAHVS